MPRRHRRYAGLKLGLERDINVNRIAVLILRLSEANTAISDMLRTKAHRIFAASARIEEKNQRCVGLAVRVAPSGLKTWDLAYRIRGSGKVRRGSLGRIVDVSLLGSQQTTNGIVAMSTDKTQP
jgi:hypothetical protein